VEENQGESKLDPLLLTESESVTVPLSVLVDQIAMGGPRDERLVMKVARWWAERRDHISFAFMDDYAMDHVMITFRVDRGVTLVITGQLPSAPGEVTIHFKEQDFPHVNLRLSAASQGPAPSLATIDYGVRGREFVLVLPYEGYERGTTGEAVCLMTVDGAVLLRGRFPDGSRLGIPDDVFELGPRRSA